MSEKFTLAYLVDSVEIGATLPAWPYHMTFAPPILEPYDPEQIRGGVSSDRFVRVAVQS